jgi:hypothetical protein
MESEDRRILVWHDEEQLGPFTREEVFEHLFARRLRADDLAWAPGLEDWMPLENVLRALTALFTEHEISSIERTAPNPVLCPYDLGAEETSAVQEATRLAPALKAALLVAGFALSGLVTFLVVLNSGRTSTGSVSRSQGSRANIANSSPAPVSEPIVKAEALDPNIGRTGAPRKEGERDDPVPTSPESTRPTKPQIAAVESSAAHRAELPIPESTGLVPMAESTWTEGDLVSEAPERSEFLPKVETMAHRPGEETVPFTLADDGEQTATPLPKSIVALELKPQRFSREKSLIEGPQPKLAFAARSTGATPSPAVNGASNVNGMTDQKVQPSQLVAKADTSALSGGDSNVVQGKSLEPEKIGIEEIPLRKPQDLETAKLWVAQTAAAPRGVLVLCSNSPKAAEEMIKQESWQEYAQKNHLALASLALSSSDKLLAAGRGYYRVSRGSGEMLLKGLRSALGENLPLLLYGRNGAAVFANNLVQWKPERVIAWAGYTNDWASDVKITDGAPPGIIASDRESIRRDGNAKKFFESGRNLDMPWTWIGLAVPWDHRERKLEEFIQEYFSTVIESDPANAGIWATDDSGRVVSESQRTANPAAIAWLPRADLREKCADLMRSPYEGYTAEIFDRMVQTRNPAQPNIHLFLRLPSSVESGSQVKGVLAYCTWENNDAAIIGKLETPSDYEPKEGVAPGSVPSLLKYAEDHKLALLTWGVKRSWSIEASTDELKRKEQRIFDRGFDTIAAAWERGATALMKEVGITQTKYLLYGTSGGAQWAHRLALRKPERFLGIHIHIPSTFDTPHSRANAPLWLLTTGELESGYERAQRFYSQCRANGYPMIFKAIPGIGHEGSALAENLGRKFFTLALATEQERAIHDSLEDSALGALRRSEPKPWLESFQNPEFFGDLVNQESFPSGEKDMIPLAFRVPLPNKSLAEAWARQQ